MDKYDVKVALKHLYKPSAKDFELVEVPPQQYLAIDGEGDPNTARDYAAAIETLFATSYGLKFASKKRGRDFTVGPLEALWRADDPAAFVSRSKDEWHWTAMIVQPDFVTSDEVDEIARAVTSKKPTTITDRMSLRQLHEGLSVQILHVGSYDDEAPTLARLHDEFMPANGLTFNGDHHEIYLSDARRTTPEKLKTVLRQPVRRLTGE